MNGAPTDAVSWVRKMRANWPASALTAAAVSAASVDTRQRPHIFSFPEMPLRHKPSFHII